MNAHQHPHHPVINAALLRIRHEMKNLLFDGDLTIEDLLAISEELRYLTDVVAGKLARRRIR